MMQKVEIIESFTKFSLWYLPHNCLAPELSVLNVVRPSEQSLAAAEKPEVTSLTSRLTADYSRRGTQRRETHDRQWLSVASMER